MYSPTDSVSRTASDLIDTDSGSKIRYEWSDIVNEDYGTNVSSVTGQASAEDAMSELECHS